MLNDSETINMPQIPMYTGFEACHVNRLIVFSQKPFRLLGCLLKIMYLCRIIQMTKEESNQNGDMEWMRRLTKFNQKPVPLVE